MKTRGKFVGGGFVAPVIAQSASSGGAFRDLSTFDANAPNEWQKKTPQDNVQPRQLVIPANQRQYWAEMDVEVERQHATRVAKETETKRQLEQYEDELMDVDNAEDEYDAYGIKLPPRPAKTGEDKHVSSFDQTAVKQPAKVTIQDLFAQHVSKIDPSGSPLGLVDSTGMFVQFFIPPGASGTKLASLLTDMSAIFHVLTARYGHQAEERAAATQILPTPISVSPLAMILLRDKGRARYTDAISSLVLLVELYQGIRELDVSNPAHKKACDAYDIKLNKLVGARFYAELDTIVNLLRVPNEYRPEQDGRAYMDTMLRRFGSNCDKFALDKIHVLEWAIMDLQRVPYILRPALMTPSGIPPNAGQVLIGQAFPIMRLNLCRYLRNRNKILCAQYEDPIESAEKRKTSVVAPRILGQAENAFMPMNPDLPPIENRLQQLAAYNKDDKAMALIAAQCVYGIYNDWIDLHTLKEWLYFLSVDDRGAADKKTSGPNMALTEDQETLKAAEEAGNAVPMDMENDD